MLIDYFGKSRVLINYVIIKLIVNFKTFHFFDLNKTSLKIHQNKKIKTNFSKCYQLEKDITLITV